MVILDKGGQVDVILLDFEKAFFFFLIYIDDLRTNFPVRCRLFADDCVVYMHIESDED